MKKKYDSAKLTQLTREEAIKKTAQSKKITEEEAAQFLDKLREDKERGNDQQPKRSA